MNDPRYKSGTSLTRTNKEEVVDSISGRLGEISDELFLALQKLTLAQLQELKRHVEALEVKV